MRSLFSFGWKLLLSSLMDTGYQHLRSFVIGKKFSSEALGYFNRGKQFPELLMNAVNGSIQSVMLPVLSEQQDDLERMKQTMRRSIMASSFLVLPLLAGLALPLGSGIPAIAVLLFALSVLAAFESPTVQACVPQMLSGDALEKGNAAVSQAAARFAISCVRDLVACAFFTRSMTWAR